MKVRVYSASVPDSTVRAYLTVTSRTPRLQLDYLPRNPSARCHWHVPLAHLSGC